MRTLLALLTLSSTTVALAATEFERFDRAVAKYATSLGREPKGLCLCQDATGLDRGTGFLLRGTNDPGLQAGTVMVALSCFVPVFDETTGALHSQAICSKFVPLAK
jgi:hypothetical protein